MSAHPSWLLIAAVSAIAVLVLLIVRVKLHPFVSLVLVSLALGLVSGMPAGGVVHSFEAGVGATLGHVAVVLALGSMLGRMLAASGGADTLAATLVRLFGPRHLPWAMLLLGLLVGLPVFFDVGFLLLIPIALTLSRQTGKPVVLLGLPLLAGLSVVHALIPPHPAAMMAVGAFHAELGHTILLALLIGVPSAVLAGPLYAFWIARRITKPAPALSFAGSAVASLDTRPGFLTTTLTLLLPVGLMLAGGWADRLVAPASPWNHVLHLLGTGDVALLAGTLLSFWAFGLARGMAAATVQRLAAESLGPAAGAMLLIGGGGGFGRILQDSNIAAAIMSSALHAHLSLLLMAWLLAALVRLATGSSTVAMTTSAAIVAPLALHTPGTSPALLAISTGAGSIFFSHVNDGGFWLIQEYLGLSVPETFASWSVLETILSVSGLLLVLLAAHFESFS